MFIDSNNKEDLLEFLIAAKKDGINWIAYDRAPVGRLNKENLRSFVSSDRAQSFCLERNRDLGRTLGSEPFCFMPITNLIRLVNGPNRSEASNLTKKQIEKEMNDNHLILPLQMGEQNSVSLFKSGQIFPVEWVKEIIPRDEIHQFHVLQNWPDRGEVRTRILQSCDNYKEADEFIKNLVPQNGDFVYELLDYLLVGQYRNKTLRIASNGHPEKSCGLTLDVAHYDWDGTGLLNKSYGWEHFGSLDKPAEIRQNFFAQYDHQKGRLILLDDKLRLINPEQTALNAMPWGFNQTGIIIKNQKVMNEKNVEYLLDQVKYAGLGENHGNEIRENIAHLPKDFKILHGSKFGEDAVSVSMNFVKSEKSDLYFFNNYDVSLKPAGSPDVTMEQQFRISNKGQSISLMEAYNMMNNRAVHKQLTNKEGKQYKAWMMLDYKNTDQNGSYKMKFFFEKYGYDLDKAISRFPIKEIMEEPNKTNVIQSLEKGNQVKVTFVINGKEHQLSVEANPNTRGINIYNGDKQRIEYGQFVAQAKAQDVKASLQKGKGKKTGQGKAKNNDKDNKANNSPGDNNKAENTKIEGDETPSQSRRRGHAVA